MTAPQLQLQFQLPPSAWVMAVTEPAESNERVICRSDPRNVSWSDGDLNPLNSDLRGYVAIHLHVDPSISPHRSKAVLRSSPEHQPSCLGHTELTNTVAPRALSDLLLPIRE
jgi:hypothetical protein